jgi:hypothetical protein
MERLMAAEPPPGRVSVPDISPPGPALLPPPPAAPVRSNMIDATPSGTVSDWLPPVALKGQVTQPPLELHPLGSDASSVAWWEADGVE